MRKVDARQKIDADLYKQLKHLVGLTPENAKKGLIELLSGLRPISARTSQQNRAMHKNFSIIAEKLNDAGWDMRKLLKILEIPWTVPSVKEYLWKSIQKAMFQKESTTELEKHVEIDKIHDVLMRELGKTCGIEYHPFPHDPDKSIQSNGTETRLEYPENRLGESSF